MSVESIRRLLRILTLCAWAGGIAAACASTYSGHRTTATQLILVAVLIAVVTCTTAGIEVFLEATARIVAAMPTSEEIASRALLAGKLLAEKEAEVAAAADLPRISDYRGR
jgi:hypothetical protein